MNYFIFFIYQFTLGSLLFTANVYFDQLVSLPFTRVDFLVIVIFIFLVISFWNLLEKLYRRFQSIRLWKKVLLSIMAFLLGVLFIGLLENIWFEFTGRMLFF